MSHTLCVAILFLSAAPLLSQKQGQGLTPEPNQTDSRATAEIRQIFHNTSANLLKATREMPENLYSFTPSEGTRTFGDMVAHITDVQSTLCGNLNRDAKRPAKLPATKQQLISDLESSIAQCEVSFAELSAQNEGTSVSTPEGAKTHIGALIYIDTHLSQEYGQLTVYLSLNHLAPPSSDMPKINRPTAAEHK
jgi:hypothetical protein